MPEPDSVPPEMRGRLLSNREGKLTGEQWKDMVSEPLVIVLLLAAPAIMVLGPRLLLGFRGFLFIAAVVLLVVMVPTLWRAFRYWRAPVHFAELYTRDQSITHLFCSRRRRANASALRNGWLPGCRCVPTRPISFIIYGIRRPMCC